MEGRRVKSDVRESELVTVQDHFSKDNLQLVTVDDYFSKNNPGLVIVEDHFSKDNSELVAVEDHFSKDNPESRAEVKWDEWDVVGDTEVYSMMKETMTQDHIVNLVEHFINNLHSAKKEDKTGLKIQNKVEELFSRDYKFSTITNTNGRLSNSYPFSLIYLEAERENNNGEEKEYTKSVLHELQEITKKMKKASLTRCRKRFIVPTILYEGKHICRSATLSGAFEVCGRILMSMGKYYFNFDRTEGDLELNFNLDDIANVSEIMDEVRGNDIALLKHLSVKHIFDLMVENKKVKYGMKFSSSEKIDYMNRYSGFNVMSIPYPGCEYFTTIADHSEEGSVKFDWTQAYIDAELSVLEDDDIVKGLKINWSKYKEWDLVRLTQNYMKLILAYLRKDKSGMLIHCISGWDRTPLYISLVRLSLWADGKIHKSLNHLEMLYLTIAYDWYLFSHNLDNRVIKQELVFFFCFEFLKYFHSEEFSVHKDVCVAAALSTGSDFPEHSPVFIPESLRVQSSASPEPPKGTDQRSNEFVMVTETGSSPNSPNTSCDEPESEVTSLRKEKFRSIRVAFNNAWSFAYKKKFYDGRGGYFENLRNYVSSSAIASNIPGNSLVLAAVSLFGGSTIGANDST